MQAPVRGITIGKKSALEMTIKVVDKITLMLSYILNEMYTDLKDIQKDAGE